MADQQGSYAAAQARLDDAVRRFIGEVGWTQAGVLTTYVMVLHQASFDSQGNDTSSYAAVHLGGSQPDHSALGLLDIARDKIRGVGRWSAQE